MSGKRQEAYAAMLEVLKVTAGNIRSLGPAGALGTIYAPYTVWLRVVEDAIQLAESAGAKTTQGTAP